MASQHSHVAKVIEKAAANPKSLMSGEAAALQAAANFVGCGPGPSMPLLPAPKVWHEALSPEGYPYYWNVETNGKKILLKKNRIIIYLQNVTESSYGRNLLGGTC